MFSRCDARLDGPRGVVGVEPEDDAGLEPLAAREALVGVSGTLLRGSGALPTRLFSRPLLDLEVPAVTVWALAGFALWVIVVSGTGSAASWGFRAWATASGPAQLGSMGTATLASTKLARMVTGNVFSFIFSWRPGSVIPKTTCWTLLYTLRQILKALDCGFEERSCR